MSGSLSAIGIVSDTPSSEAIERSAIGKIYRHLISYILLAFFVCFLERTNVAFAALEFRRELGFSATTFGTGASIFFLTYIALTLPSTALLRWAPPHVWICRMLILWGLLTAATALVHGAWSFYLVRALLGASEACFFPFIIAYTSAWLPEKYRARMMGIYMLGIPLSGLIGSPISGTLIDAMHGVAGISGWKWMFIVEGIPATLLGLAGFRMLIAKPENAAWLNVREREWLVGRLEADKAGKVVLDSKSVSVRSVCLKPSVIALGLCYALAAFNMYGITYFLPQIVGDGRHMSNTVVGFTSAIPFLAGAVGMIILPWLADRQGRHQHYSVGALIAGAAGFLFAGFALSAPVIALTGLCVAAVGIWAATPLILSLPLKYFTGSAIAPVIAVLTSIGNIGAATGPVMTGVLRDRTGDFLLPLLIFAAAMTIAALLVVAAIRLQSREGSAI